MNKGALKKFATEARKELREKIRVKAYQLGITEEKIKKESLQSSDSVFVDGKQLSIEEKRQRNRLIDEIKDKGFDRVIEEVAYTWFNRFTALRFMEVNEYLPSKVRVLSSRDQGSYEPDIIKEALTLDWDIDKEFIYELKMSNDNDAIDRLYKYLIIKECNELNKVLPLIFEKILDYNELLFPDGILAEGSFLRTMTDKENIPEEDWEDVEVIGWLYQYYISERKDEVFEGLRKNRKITKNDIAPATQLFTPHWIVRYMVENSLGKLWQEGHPNEELKKNWTYYIEEVEQEEEVKSELNKLKEESKKLKVEDIKIIDPAMGSSHILVYAFDLLYDIYISQGYIPQEIPKLIIEKNLYGIDIDERAFQLAYFALMMKGRSKSRRFFHEPVAVNICAIKESNSFPKEAIEYLISPKSMEIEKALNRKDVEYLINVFHDAKEYGSIIKVDKINFDAIEKRLEELRNEINDMFELEYRDKILEVIPDLVKQGRIMSQMYDVMITNPPYMGSKGMNPKLTEFVGKNYLDTKSDLFAVFMELDEHLLKKNGFMAMINQHSWMFLSSFEKYRKRMLAGRTIVNMLHLGPRAFEEIGGEVVQSTAFVNRKKVLENYKGTYIRLVEYSNAELKEEKAIEGIKGISKDKFIANGVNFNKIPGSPIAYWVSNNWLKLFSKIKPVSDYMELKKGMSTGDNARFIKYWYEVSLTKIGFKHTSIEDAKNSNKKWFPINSGGGFRKWYGNNIYVANWENDGKKMKDNAIMLNNGGHWSRYIVNTNKFFLDGITWTAISSSNFGVRYFDNGFLFSSASMCGYNEEQEKKKFILALLNTKITQHILSVLAPTLNFGPEQVKKVPCLFESEEIICKKSSKNIAISRTDWNSFETSWDFKRHPLLQFTSFDGPCTIESAFEKWKEFTEAQFNQLKANEEELNRIFIEIYGLQDELTPEVEDKDITISKADRERDIKSFISYAVGCMFGRYSLDEEGLSYAGGEFDPSKYRLFPADKDNVLPIVYDSYFDDDIVSRFIEFVQIVFGKETLNENLKYIAESLGVRGDETPKEAIRRYFLNDFYKNHVQIYKKRPIYWLFTSGKEKAFNALIYMHRYDSSTLARIRTDYLHVLQSRLQVRKQSLIEKIDGATSPREKKSYEKELKDLDKKLIELKEYDEVLNHMANMKIEIDLDDGVAVNYEKFKGLLEKI